MKKNKFEDSPQDEREDRAMAKKLGMSKAKWAVLWSVAAALIQGLPSRLLAV